LSLKWRTDLRQLALQINKLKIIFIIFIISGCASSPEVEVGKVSIILEPVHMAEIKLTQ